jgi:Transposase DDE domain
MSAPRNCECFEPGSLASGRFFLEAPFSARSNVDCRDVTRMAVTNACVTAPDTPLNQEAFPEQKCQRPGCGFPIIRLSAFFSLATGMLLCWACGSWAQSEIALLQLLWNELRPGDLLLGDRGFGGWAVLAQCRLRGIEAVLRVRGSRRSDFRYGKRISKHERLVRWHKPRQRAASVSPELWRQLPEYLDLRLVRSRLSLPGFRTRQVILVTTLLDPVKYSATDLGLLYLRRWDMELSLRHLKTTLQMEHLSCKTPDTLDRELRMHLLMHNLVRRLMLEAARRNRVPLNRLSFAGALALARRYSEALLQAHLKRQRLELIQEIYRLLAADLVPDRPGRREPRAIKRRPKPFPKLMNHRSRYLEAPHKSRYWKNSPCKRKAPRKWTS